MTVKLSQVFRLGFLVTFLLFPLKGLSQVWEPTGLPLSSRAFGVRAIDGYIYAGIRKDTINNQYLYNVGRYDGNNWDSLGAGIDGGILTIAELNNKIYIGGQFINVNGPFVTNPHEYNITFWDGNTFSDLHYPTFTPLINKIHAFQNELYIGYDGILTINGQQHHGLVRLNDTTYSSVGGGVFHPFREVEVFGDYNNSLVVGGRFSTAGTTPVNNIALWDGNQWTNIGNGLNYYVRSLCWDSTNNLLYVGGSFNYAYNSNDTIVTNFIAKWDGVEWSNVGSEIAAPVTALTIYKGSLYAGTNANFGNNPSALWKWNGTIWTPILPAPNNMITSLTVYNNKLYAAGNFNEIGGQPYAGFARFIDTTTVNIPEYSNERTSFIIYPNPTRREIILSFTNTIFSKVEITIHNSKGELIFRQSNILLNRKLELELPKNLSQGIYLCKVIGENIYLSESFIYE